MEVFVLGDAEEDEQVEDQHQGGEGGQGALPLPGQLHRGGEPGWRSSRMAAAVERGAGKQLGAFKPSFGSFSAKKIPLGNIGSLCCLKWLILLAFAYHPFVMALI